MTAIEEYLKMETLECPICHDLLVRRKFIGDYQYACKQQCYELTKVGEYIRDLRNIGEYIAQVELPLNENQWSTQIYTHNYGRLIYECQSATNISLTSVQEVENFLLL